MPQESVEKISAESLIIKYWIKLPMIIFVNLASMASTISMLLLKMIGCVLTDAKESSDYLWLLLFVPCLVCTGNRTLVYVNYGIKYYK